MAAAHEFALSVDIIPAGTRWRITDSGANQRYMEFYTRHKNKTY